MPADASHHSPLTAAVQILTFDPGLYSVTFGAERSMESDVGFRFPRARLDAPASGPGLVVVALQGENGWLARPGDTAMVQVTGAQMSLLLTTYQIEGANAAPVLRVNRIADYRGQAPQPGAAAPAPAVPSLPPRPAAAGLVHVGGRGDVPLGPDGWGGAPRGSSAAIEGFAIQAPAGIAPAEVEYQGILGRDWTTPWTQAGEFCGSRGLALPLLGFTVRLGEKAGARLGCSYKARFQDGSVVEAADGAPCLSPSGAAVEAIWLSWTLRDVLAVPSTAAVPSAAVAPATAVAPSAAVAPAEPPAGPAPLDAEASGEAAAPAAKAPAAKPARPAVPPTPARAPAKAAAEPAGRAVRGKPPAKPASKTGKRR